MFRKRVACYCENFVSKLSNFLSDILNDFLLHFFFSFLFLWFSYTTKENNA